MTYLNTAPLKIILFGEHTVTRGKTCVAVAINILANMQIVTDNKKGSISAKVGRNLIINLTDIVDISNTNINLLIQFAKNFGCGLGSSAAVSVLIARFIHDYNQNYSSKLKLLVPNNNITIKKLDDLSYFITKNMELMVEEIIPSQNNIEDNKSIKDDKNSKIFKYKIDRNKEGEVAQIQKLNNSCISQDIKITNVAVNHNDMILNMSLQIENKFHGKSSGVDVTASYVTGIIAYKNYSYAKISSKYLNEYKIMIYDSKIMKNTEAILNKMIYNQKIYEEIGTISENVILLLQRRFTLEEMYFYIRKNQDLLEDLGIVPEEMKQIVRGLRLRGIESKITGAGFGGHLFTIVDKNEIIEDWEEVSIYEID